MTVGRFAARPPRNFARSRPGAAARFAARSRCHRGNSGRGGFIIGTLVAYLGLAGDTPTPHMLGDVRVESARGAHRRTTPWCVGWCLGGESRHFAQQPVDYVPKLRQGNEDLVDGSSRAISVTACPSSPSEQRRRPYLVLLHCYPRLTDVHRVAQALREQYFVVLPDRAAMATRPTGRPADHSNYSKRTMAHDVIG